MKANSKLKTTETPNSETPQSSQECEENHNPHQLPDPSQQVKVLPLNYRYKQAEAEVKLRQAAIPLKGFAWNPLLSLPPNQPCPCRSKRKFKKCCLLILPRIVTEDNAKAYAEQMKKPDLVFLTPENKTQVEGELAKLEEVKTDAASSVAAD